MESERTQEYLEAIYKRQRSEKPVATSTLAEDLKVSPPAVTDMLHSLESKGLIDLPLEQGGGPNRSWEGAGCGGYQAAPIVGKVFNRCAGYEVG